MTRRFVVALFVIAGSLEQAHAEDPPEVEQHLSAAAKHFEQREYAKAVAEFEAAYAIEPRPEVLYNLAQALRLGGDCRRAIASYEAFLASTPDAKLARLSRENIDLCKEILGDPVPTPSPALPTTPQAAPTPPAEPASHGDRVPIYRDITAIALTAVGVGIGVTGTIVWLNGRDATRAANEATTYAEFDAHAHGELHQRLGVAGMAVGGAFVAAGVLQHLLRAPRATPVVHAAVRGDGSVTVQGSWRW